MNIKSADITVGETQEVSESSLHNENELSLDGLEEKFTILIVEDSPAELLRLNVVIKKWGYNTLTAQDGREAIDVIRANHIDLVITDWQMPNMNGVDLCKELKSCTVSCPYIIMLTGRTNKFELITALDAGADDYLSKPVNVEELRVRVKAGLRISNFSNRLSHQYHLLKCAYDRERKINKRLKQTFNDALALQREALPDQFSNTNNILSAHYFQHAACMAGDLFSILRLSDTEVAFYQINTSFKGIRATTFSLAIAKYLKELANRHEQHDAPLNILSPSLVMGHLNQKFCAESSKVDYFTMIYGVVDCETGRTKLTQAGHPHPYLVKPDNSIVELGYGGFPVGLALDADYKEIEFDMQAGSRLILFTDGVFECEAPSGMKANKNTIPKILKQIQGESLNKFHEELSKLIAKLKPKRPLSDDLSIFILERAPENA